MKFIKEIVTENGGGKTRYCYAVGKKEAEILLSLIEKAKQFMPRVPETEQTQSRLQNMARCVSQSIKEFEGD